MKLLNAYMYLLYVIYVSSMYLQLIYVGKVQIRVIFCYTLAIYTCKYYFNPKLLMIYV